MKPNNENVRDTGDELESADSNVEDANPTETVEDDIEPAENVESI